MIIRPREATLAARGGAQVWREVTDTVAGKIYGPHFEDLAREWTLLHAAPETLGGTATRVARATIACSEHKTGHEIDVVAQEDLPHEPTRLLAIGEAKATEKPVGDGELARLEHLRELLPSDKVADRVILLLFSRSGFTKELRQGVEGRDDIDLVDLDRLYRGD